MQMNCKFVQIYMASMSGKFRYFFIFSDSKYRVSALVVLEIAIYDLLPILSLDF